MNAKKTQFSEEVRLVPWWAITLAVVLFVGIQVLMHVLGFRREPNPPPVPFQILIGLLIGTLAAFVMLLIGYVNRDSGRRGMNSTLWTLLVIFIPNAIGFILYFLLRQPILIQCPQCGTATNPNVNYCSKCKYNLRPTCSNCKHAVTPGDRFCPYCAYDLEVRAPV
ncbi:MAG: zinc ribbon domain-containing protein [Acidobacteria bacterium]|nr:zinc ribbon domain-containing protein [Acidobacteriota bacterium]